MTAWCAFDGPQRRFGVLHGDVFIDAIAIELDAADVHVDDIGFRRPTLDEVFLSLTGRPAEEKVEVEA